MREPLRERLRRYGNLALDKIRRCPAGFASVVGRHGDSSANPSGTSAQCGSRHQDGPLPFAGTGCRVIGLVPKGRIRNGPSPVADRLCAGRRFSRQPAAGRFPSLPAPYSKTGVSSQSAGTGSDEHFASVIVRLQHLAHVQQQRADPLQLLDDLQIAADSLAVLSRRLPPRPASCRFL